MSSTVDRTWPRRLVVGVFLGFIPAWIVWVAITPFYNRFLAVSAENLLHLTESPDVTSLLPQQNDPTHRVVVTRTDFPPASSKVHQVRVTDIHFHLVLLTALFLGVPGVPWGKKLSRLGAAALIAVFFHILLLFLWVKFVYATQLGEWSMQNYGAFSRNAYGLGKHLLDLPFKLALPLALWAGFYLRTLLPRSE